MNEEQRTKDARDMQAAYIAVGGAFGNFAAVMTSMKEGSGATAATGLYAVAVLQKEIAGLLETMLRLVARNDGN